MRYVGLSLLILLPAFLVYVVVDRGAVDEIPLDVGAQGTAPRISESDPRLGGPALARCIHEDRSARAPRNADLPVARPTRCFGIAPGLAP